MKSLSSPVTSAIAASQVGVCELMDIYLRSTITTPAGSSDTLRLCNLDQELNGSRGFSFFKPKVDPETDQGTATTYTFWPWKRETVKAEGTSTNDKLRITASNVTTEWAQMLADVDWQDTYFILRKALHTIASPTADDCAILFIGQVDSYVVTNETITFTLSNNLANLAAELPSENMHTTCRFRWADDQCTAIRFHENNYKSKTVGSSSSTTRIKSADLTEDGATRRYEGQSVTADSTTDKITLSAHGLNNGDRVYFGGTAVPGGLTAATWYYVVNKGTNDFQLATTAGGSAINLTSNGTSVTLYSETLYGADLVAPLADAAITASSQASGWGSQSVTLNGTYSFVTLTGHGFSLNDPFYFDSGTPPSGLALNTTYYVQPFTVDTFGVKASVSGSLKVFGGAGSSMKLTSGAYGSVSGSYESFRVRLTDPNYWKFSDSADWGTLDNGYYQIPDAQSGLANPALKPWIQFDFGSAKAVKTWLISTVADVKLEELIRTIAVFSSSSSTFTTFRHECWFEIPPRGGQFYEMLIPEADSARYWRICIRNRWAASLFYSGLAKVRAFESGVHYWASGRIKFASNTTTTALRNVTRMIKESYTGEVVVGALDTAPANGDTFVIERGCPRTFNGCNERRNAENFGGFLDLPTQTVIR